MSHSSAIGLPPGLRVSGPAGEREVSDASGNGVLMEVHPGIWAPLIPYGSWERWRQFAQALLDTQPPPDSA